MDTKEYSKVIDRISILDSLINFSESLDLLSAKLSSFSWDYTERPVILSTEHLINVINRCLLGKLSITDIETWANLIECREDISYEKSNLEEIDRAIFMLANPDLEGELSTEKLKDAIDELKVKQKNRLKGK